MLDADMELGDYDKLRKPSSSVPSTIHRRMLRCSAVVRPMQMDWFRFSLVMGAILTIWYSYPARCRSTYGSHPRVTGYHYYAQDDVFWQPREVLAFSGPTHTEQLTATEKTMNDDSEDYAYNMRDSLYEGDCVPMQPWQETSFPVCNKIHEVDLTDGPRSLSHIAHGGYNDVFRITDVNEQSFVMKMLLYRKDHTDRNLDRVRRDALIMERLTKSPFIVDIFAFCGFTQVVELGDQHHLEWLLWHPQKELDPTLKLQLATQAAQALADAHNIDGDGRSSISHGDFAAKQFIKVKGVYKLNDFNRGRFIRWDKEKKEPCPYTIGKNDGVVRFILLTFSVLVIFPSQLTKGYLCVCECSFARPRNI
jgi:hypothetical protein